MLQKILRLTRAPTCHLEPDSKKWVDEWMIWLHGTFGPGPIRRPPLDLDSQLLPRTWKRTKEAGRDLFTRLCQFMLVDPSRVQLGYYMKDGLADISVPLYGETSHPGGAAGLYFHPDDGERLMIAVDVAGLADPMALSGTICHELGHVHLLADKRISRDDPSSEPLTDLLTVYFGAGILTANSAFRFHQWQTVSGHGWSASRKGYLTEELYGYALACYAWYRGEAKPPWTKYLKENVRYYYEDSRHYLAKTRETPIPFDGP